MDATRLARPRGRVVRAHAAPKWRGEGANSWLGPRRSTWMPGWCPVAMRGQAGEGPTGWWALVIVLGW